MPADVVSTQSAVDQEIQARKCAFDPSTLRWVPEETAAPITVRLLRKETSGGKECGAPKLMLGDQEVTLARIRTVGHLAPSFLAIHVADLGHVGLQCSDEAALKTFVTQLSKFKADYERFSQYDQSSVQSYFQYYAKLGSQQNMLQDSIRTMTYRQAIMDNIADFNGASVMDVGAGSGILSFFSAQAGASNVYAVEASSMAEVVRKLADSNDLGGATVHVLNKPLENILDSEVDGKVDLLVSEPIGTFLFNERMIETYLCARDRFLKPGGKMFPNVGNLCIAPFSDPVLHQEQAAKNEFWKNKSFYGLDLTAALPRCTEEHFRQPIVDYINPDCLVADYKVTRFDFMTVTVESLQHIEIPLDFEVRQPCLVHGVAGWFDAFFEGSTSTVVLSTAPGCPGTHWYQIRFMLQTPLAVNAGQHLVGTLTMEANHLQSYYVKVVLRIDGTNISSEAACIDLKDPEYRFYTSPNAYYPPGTPGLGGAVPAAVAPVAAAQAPEQQVPQVRQQPAAHDRSKQGTAESRQRSRSANRRAVGGW